MFATTFLGPRQMDGSKNVNSQPVEARTFSTQKEASEQAYQQIDI
jgi:hypothetical protein